MEMTLYLPGLLLPEVVLTDTAFDLDAPALSWMLGRSKREELPSGWLADAFGTHDPLPAAALRKVSAGPSQAGAPPVGSSEPGLRARGVDKIGTGGDWLCLDPVNWQVTREGITLGDPALLDLSEQAAADLRGSIAPLFDDWGILSASSPSCWELQLAH